MQTIKKGSTGEDVKTLQRMIGVTSDGIFGAKTEEAVKKWQLAHGLYPDGIVGDKTWALLTGGIAITSAPINVHVTYTPKREVKYIAIHYTAGSTSRQGTARNTRNVFLSRSASADFVVDDGEIVQINPDLRNYYCWSVGDKKNPYSGGGRLYGIANNKNTISIEICSNLRSGTSAAAANHEGWYFTEKSLERAVQLTKYLMKQFNIPKDRVVRHYDISGKLCPGVKGWNDAMMYTTDGKAQAGKNNSLEWQKFLAKL